MLKILPVTKRIINIKRQIKNNWLYNALKFIMQIKKPLTNPANQFGSLIFWFSIKGLWIGTIPGNAVFNSSDKPKFIDALIPTSFFFHLLLDVLYY